MNPLVSYIVPCFNYERYIRECLGSLIHQTYPHLEIIVINDGSTDNSQAIVEEMMKQDSRIRLINQPNSGQLISKNKGVSLSRGDYFSIVDADDALPPDRTEKMLVVFAKQPKTVLVYGDALVIDENSKPIRRFFEIYPPIPGDFSVQMWRHYCFGSLITLMFRKSTFDQIGPFWSMGERGESQDYMKAIEMGLHGEVVCLEKEILGLYRRHHQNITTGSPEKKAKQYEIQKKNLEEILKRHPALSEKISHSQKSWRLARCHFMAAFYAGLDQQWDLARKQFATAWKLHHSLLNLSAWISTLPLIHGLAHPFYRWAARKLY